MCFRGGRILVVRLVITIVRTSRATMMVMIVNEERDYRSYGSDAKRNVVKIRIQYRDAYALSMCPGKAFNLFVNSHIHTYI